MSTTTSIDETKLNEFMGKMLGDMGAAMNAALVLLGDELGLWKAMADAGPLTAGQLAEKTGTYPRYVREWLSAQAARDFAKHLVRLPEAKLSALAGMPDRRVRTTPAAALMLAVAGGALAEAPSAPLPCRSVPPVLAGPRLSFSE